MTHCVSAPLALTIAGSDPSGGAGLQADLKTFHQHHVYGMAVVSLLTVQSTKGVTQVQTVEPALLTAQLLHLLDDLTPGAAKTGALGTAALVEAVAAQARHFAFPLVVDPVMVSKHGHALLDEAAQRALRVALLPCASLLTPNVPEAEVLLGARIASVADARAAAQALWRLGAKAVLVKGGHLEGPATDVLFDGVEWLEFTAPRSATPHTHGTGCTLSAAITAQLALGRPLKEAVARAKAYLTRALETAPGLGHGVGPVNHFARVD